MKIKSVIKNNFILLSVGILVLIATVLGVTYSYFTFRVDGTGQTNLLVSGDLALYFNDGNSLVAVEMFPGDSVQKSFNVENVSDFAVTYNIGWDDLVNTFTGNEIVVSLTCTQYNDNNGEHVINGTCNGISNQPVSLNQNIIENVSIQPGYSHHYNVTILFLDTGSNQNYNKGQDFNGTLKIEGVN